MLYHFRIRTLVQATILFLLAWSANAADDNTDFQPLFDGRTLEGWDGDERFWRVDDGAIVGQTTDDNQAEHNTFLIYRGGEFGDFELRFSYQVDGYNSGVQYRSRDQGDYVVHGYQADFEDRWHQTDGGPADRFSGMFFEEGGRMFLGQRGEAVIVKADPRDPQKHLVEKVGMVGDPAELERHIRRDGWNEYTVIAHGFQFTHIINGHVMAIGIDEHEARRREDGVLAFQLHSGPPMSIRIKDIRIRELP